MEDSQNLLITIEFADTVTEFFHLENCFLKVYPVDFNAEDNYTSKPRYQTNSKHAFPFGAQVSTPCTYGVF
jgi:hypothetical protein